MKKSIISFVVLFVFVSFNAMAQSGGNLPVDNAVDENTFDNFLQGQIKDDGLASTDAGRFATMCDDFNRSNSTVVDGWTEQSGDWQIYDNKLQSPGTGVWNYITMDGSSQTNGCVTVRAIYGSPVQVKFIAVLGRFSGESSSLLFKIQDNDANGYWNSIWLYENRNNLIFYLTSQNYGTDAIIQMEYHGSDVTLRVDTDRDGSWEYENTVTVSNTSAGHCGIGAYRSAFADDFCCGENCEIVPVPIANYAIVIALVLIAGLIAFRRFR